MFPGTLFQRALAGCERVCTRWTELLLVGSSLLTQPPAKDGGQPPPSLIYRRCPAPGRMRLGKGGQSGAADLLELIWAWGSSGFWQAVPAGRVGASSTVLPRTALFAVIAGCGGRVG